MTAKTLMIMGTGSSVGKSLLTAALCRIFKRSGLRVAPFKAQNMSNNAAVCANGDEIGRAQAVQARAAGLEPCADMNPVLLKPEGATRSQVIVQGKPWETLHAVRFYARKKVLWPIVTSALDRLRASFELVIIEGAGSPVELNLKNSDIVNMAVAQYARSPVLLVGDIDRGGIFAHLLGTLALLTAEERALVRGLIINKFRGDRRLFAEGVTILEERGKCPVLGIIPYLADLAIPEEDAVVLEKRSHAEQAPVWDLAVIHLPHIANFDDFDPLSREPGVRVRYVRNASELGQPHAILLPGSKSTMADLAWLRMQGLDLEIVRQAREKVAVVGICGGMQMLGQVILDPDQVESSTTAMPGLGLLSIETTFARTKITRQVTAVVQENPGWMQALQGSPLRGYEIHMGFSMGGTPWLEILLSSKQAGPRLDGAISDDGRIWGCYLHGLFDNPGFRREWLRSLGPSAQALTTETASSPVEDLDRALDRLADAVVSALPLPRLLEIL